MATIKIISGSFPAQDAQLVLDQLTVSTSEGVQRTYPAKHCIVSLKTVSGYKDNAVFDMELNDGSRFQGRADKKTLQYLEQFAGAKLTPPLLTPEQIRKRDRKIMTVAIGLALVFLVYQCTGGSEPKSPTPVVPDAPVTQQSKTESLMGEVKVFEGYLEETEEYFKTHKVGDSDFERIRKTLHLFHNLADYLNNARKDKTLLSAEDIAHLKGVEQRLAAFQKKTLPGLRLAFRKQAADLLWEHDVYVRVLGNSNTTIEFTAGIFAANANIKKVQLQMNDTLTRLRFKQTRFKWYKGADEYTYYKLDTPPDGTLAMFKFGVFQDMAAGF